MAKKLCTKEIETQYLHDKEFINIEAYIACRLIPLDKNPGVRPIGIGEVLRRRIGKSVLSVVKQDVLEAAGNLQLCAGQPGGCEAAVHAVSDILKKTTQTPSYLFMLQMPLML